MIALLVVLLVTSQYLNAYPLESSIGTKNHYPINLRLKRDYGLLQHHEVANDIPFNLDENFPNIYWIIHGPNRKRLIDF